MFSFVGSIFDNSTYQNIFLRHLEYELNTLDEKHILVIPPNNKGSVLYRTKFSGFSISRFKFYIISTLGKY